MPEAAAARRRAFVESERSALTMVAAATAGTPPIIFSIATSPSSALPSCMRVALPMPTTSLPVSALPLSMEKSWLKAPMFAPMCRAFSGDFTAKVSRESSVPWPSSNSVKGKLTYQGPVVWAATVAGMRVQPEGRLW